MPSAQAGVPVPPQEARTGHGWDAVTEILPAFVRRDSRASPPCLTLKKAFNIALAVQNANDAEGISV